ncbi:MAG TPA: ABC transporter permease [Steroidobacteraceae bacterium]|jgi:putative ABC transport system permease protein|nr:ABC transporter permease [Steroidobacteraceae bacterium]
MLDGLQEIYYTLRQNKLRTLLTAFGVFWGIFMLIVLLGFGRGMQNGIMEDFGSDVLDFIIVWTGDTSVAYHGMGLGRKIQLDLADIQAVRQQIPGIRVISAERFADNGTINYGRKSSNGQILGIPDEYFTVKEDVPFNFGRKVNPLDLDESRKVVVIGTAVAERLFAKGEEPVGKQVRVKDTVMKVVGIFYDKGERGRNSERVLMPLTTMQKMYGGGAITSNIWVRPDKGVDGFELEKKVLELLKRRHDVAPEDTRGINSFNMAEPMKRVTGLFIGINVFMWFVGLGTLMAGIVGISNIMIITVKERTREIGVRKALGATPFSIISTLLFESMLVTAVAGYVGLVFGVSLLELIAFALRSSGAKAPYFLNPEVNFQVAITAILLLVGVGILAGLMPALRAAKITPTEAMRAG